MFVDLAFFFTQRWPEGVVDGCNAMLTGCTRPNAARLAFASSFKLCCVSHKCVRATILGDWGCQEVKSRNFRD